MTTEQDKAREALQMAIQMEIDGKNYYLKVSQQSGNELGRKLMQTLATEEDYHRQKFIEIYNAIMGKKTWPTTDFKPDGGKRLRTIFAKASEEIDTNIKAFPTEFDAVQTAMTMENKTYDFYKTRGEATAYDAEQNFYQAVAAEEREHYLILLDYFEYLKDPAAWFVAKEHPSLDGA